MSKRAREDDLLPAAKRMKFSDEFAVDDMEAEAALTKVPPTPPLAPPIVKKLGMARGMRPIAKMTPLARPAVGLHPTPVPSVRAPAPMVQPPAALPVNTGEAFFACMFMKPTKKKNKRFDGDGVLALKGERVTMYDTEGKQLASMGLLKESDRRLASGQILYFSNYECEVGDAIRSEDFKSGKIFIAETTTACAPIVAKKAPRLPLGTLLPVAHGPEIKVPIKPLHDPDSPDAFVLYRAASPFNADGSPNVSVVVDPFIARRLRPHQKEAVQFLYDCVTGKRSTGKGAILADEMGLGKTFSTISLIYTMLHQGERGEPWIRKAIVVAPSSIVVNWANEVNHWIGNLRLKTAVVVGTNSEAKAIINDFRISSLKPLLVISYETFRQHAEELENVNCGLIVCDEGHRLKNAQIKTSKAIVSQGASRRIILSGTPIQNDLQEFWNVVEFVNPGILGTYPVFKRVYEDPIIAARERGASAETKALGTARGEQLSQLTGQFILRRTQEMMKKYLPPQHHLVLFCKLTDVQVALYKQLVRSRFISSGAGGGFKEALPCITWLKKLCAHPSLVTSGSETAVSSSNDDDDDNVTATVALDSPIEDVYDCFDVSLSGKMMVLYELLSATMRDTNDKVVVVSNSTRTLTLIGNMSENAGWTTARLDGSVQVQHRQEIVDNFNEETSSRRIFLLSARAGGVGLNLIGANRLILFDPDWNPATDTQAMSRVWRDGQRKEVFIYRLLGTGSIEEKIWQRQIQKQSVSSALMDEVNARRHFTAQELRNLFVLNERTLSDTHDTFGCACSGGGHQLTAKHSHVETDADIDALNNTDLSDLSGDLNQPLSTPPQPAADGKEEELTEWRHHREFTPQCPGYLPLSADAQARITYVFSH